MSFYNRKKFVKLFENFNTRDYFNEIKDILIDFCDSNEIEVFDFKPMETPMESGLYSCIYDGEYLDKIGDTSVIKRLSRMMIDDKYLSVMILVNGKNKDEISEKNDEIFNKINNFFIKRIESIGYSAKINRSRTSGTYISSYNYLININYSKV